MRIYCVPETSAAMQMVVEQEERLGCAMVADSRHFLMREHGPLCICVEDVSAGCTVRPGSLYQVQLIQNYRNPTIRFRRSRKSTTTGVPMAACTVM